MRHVLMVVLLVIGGALAFGGIVMMLWNWLVPALFGGRLITFWQALGVLVLSKILFGGFHRGHGFGGRGRVRLIDKWERMTPEEREKFKAGMRHRCEGGSPA
ncbi:MAG: hypothetical protein ABSF22_24650 [Bryobacteraceae bacterium]